MSVPKPIRSWPKRILVCPSWPSSSKRPPRRLLTALPAVLLIALLLSFLPYYICYAVDDPEPIRLSGTIDAYKALTLVTDEGGRPRPYLVSGELLVSAMLRYEPGVEIIFERNAWIHLVKDGALTKTLDSGSATTTFRGLEHTPGYWRGIVADVDSKGLHLRYCDVSDATTAVSSETKAPWIASCTLYHNEVGLAMTAHGAGDQQLENIVIRDNTGYALRYFMSPNVITGIISMRPAFHGLEVKDNGVDAVQVDKSLTDYGWQRPLDSADLNLSSPETVDGDRLPLDLPVTSVGELQTLSFEPGSIVRSRGLRIGEGATFSSLGRPADPIRFLPSPDSVTYGWDGIRLDPGATARMDHCEISGAGSAPALTVATDATVTHCTIRNNGGRGLALSGTGIEPILDALTIVDNAGDAIFQRTADMHPRFTDLTVSGNGRDALVLYDGGISGDVTLDSMVMASTEPLPILGGLAVRDGGFLSILPGTEVYMDGSQRLTVQAGGVLSATGALITGLTPQPGSWRGVTLDEGSTALLQDCTVGYGGVAGQEYLSGVLTIASSDVTVRNSRLHDGPNNGVQLYGDGLTPVLQDLVIEDNAAAAVREWNREPYTMNPTYDNLVANNNGLDAVVLDAGGYFTDATLKVPGQTTGGVLPYVVRKHLSVGSDATLTLEKDVVMQFMDAQYLFVYGHLVADGVTFTGQEETPGSWSAIFIMKGGSADLQNCQILYAGAVDTRTRYRGTALHIESAEPVSLHGCTIRDSASLAVDITGGTHVDMRWNNFYDNEQGFVSSAQTDLAGPRSNSSTTAVQYSANARTPTDARFSWWGHASGPAHILDNPDGLGTHITGNVHFSPWAESPVLEYTRAEAERVYVPLTLR